MPQREHLPALQAAVWGKHANRETMWAILLRDCGQKAPYFPDDPVMEANYRAALKKNLVGALDEICAAAAAGYPAPFERLAESVEWLKTRAGWDDVRSRRLVEWAEKHPGQAIKAVDFEDLMDPGTLSKKCRELGLPTLPRGNPKTRKSGKKIPSTP